MPTKSLNRCARTIEETNRRREKQLAYNEENNITPRQIVKAASNILNDMRKKTGEKTGLC